MRDEVECRQEMQRFLVKSEYALNLPYRLLDVEGKPSLLTDVEQFIFLLEGLDLFSPAALASLRPCSNQGRRLASLRSASPSPWLHF